MAGSAHVVSDDEVTEGATARASAASAGKAAAQPRLWTAVFVLIVLLTFCCFVMGQGLNAGTSVFLSRVGYGASLAGVLALVFSASAAVARLVIGPIIDAGKCSLVILLGMVILLAGTVVPLAGQGVALYTASRVLQGVGFAMATTAASTAAADVLPRARLGEGIGYYGLGQALAMSVGPALALFLAGTDPASNLYAGLSLVAVAGLAVAFFTRYERKPLALPETSAFRERWERAERAKAQAAEAEPQAAKGEAAQAAKGEAAQAVPAVQAAQGKAAKAPSFFEPRALPGAIPMTIMCPTFGFGIFFVGLYGTQIGVANASLFYTISAISMIAVRLKSKSFMDRVAPIKTFTVAVACGLVTCVMLYFGPASDYVFYAAGVFYGLCLGISLPLNQAVAVKNTPPERWGATNALFLLMNDVGIGLASALWGFTNDAFGFGVTICLVMVCLVASYVAAWVFYPEKDRAWR
ncbi:MULTISPECIES: MFS transporter [unclassified Adlercreutzia]|uniref:MFS transporter n=1 Tax=unclassified Adlercreutzia TaxID=2636013 RepID=UPI001981AA1D|nr:MULTISPECIES: MFS transporter [unclassified Adlercreutzia]